MSLPDKHKSGGDKISTYAKLVNKMTFSFSRLHLYEQCPYAFYRRYIEEDEGEGNFYADNGSILHDIFKRLLLKEITLDEAVSIYPEEFDGIYNVVNQSTMDKTFEKCHDYLCQVDAFDFEKYEVIAVEQKMNFKIDKYAFVGYVDFLIRENESKEVILTDHKSANHFLKKDGSVLKNMQDDYNAYSKQMYIYCKAIKDIYGLQVDKIAWHHFKDDGRMTVIDFNQEDYTKTLGWCKYTIEKIKKDKRFDAKQSFMMCRNLCNFRNDCEYLEKE